MLTRMYPIILPPMVPVPNTSPIEARSLLPVLLNTTPARNAPIMLPGNAKREPVPRMFLRSEIKKAFERAYQGPGKTYEIT